MLRDSTSTTKPKRVLFVTYGGGHVNMVVPVVHRLAGYQGIECQVLGLTTANTVLSRESIPFFGFRDLVSDVDEAALAHGRRLAASLPVGAVSREETEAYLGLSYADLEERLGAEVAAEEFATKGRQAFLPLSAMRRLLQTMKPDLVVATSAPRAERAAIMAAGELGIPSVCLVDLFASQESAWVGLPGYATRVCVLSEFVRDRLLKAGRSADEVVVTGNPSFDRLARPDLCERGAALRVERGWTGSKVILWLSQPEASRHPFTGKKGDPNLARQVDQALVALLDRHSDWQLVIRPHPSENVKFGSLPERVYVSHTSEELAPLLMASDLALTMSSTAGLEAALIGKPLVTLSISNTSADAPYAEMGIARNASSLRELEEALVEVLGNRWAPAARLPKTGQAAKLVVECLLGVLGLASLGSDTRLALEHQ